MIWIIGTMFIYILLDSIVRGKSEERVLRCFTEICEKQQRQSNYLKEVWRLVMTENLKISTGFNGKKLSGDEIQDVIDRCIHSHEEKEDHEWEGTTTEQLLAIRHNHEYKRQGK